MDFTRVTSPPSIHVDDFNGQHGSYQPTSKPALMPFLGTRAPMPIPNSRGEPPPPPLPPPPNMDDLTAGSDLGWKWGNMPGGGGFDNIGGSVSSQSSLRGHWDRRREGDGSSDRPDYARRGSSTTTIKSPPDVEVKHEPSRYQDEGCYGLSGPGLATYELVKAFLLTVLLVSWSDPKAAGFFPWECFFFF